MLQLVEIDQNRFAVEVVNGTVRANLTQMAKPFGKNPKDFFKNDWSAKYLEKLSKRRNIPLADLVQVRKGGNIGNMGTWAYEHNVVIEFARWLNIDFAIDVNELVFKLLTNQAAIAMPFMGVEPVIHNGRSWYYYRDVLKSIGFSITSGTVAKRKRLNEKHFVKLFGRNFIDLEYCQQLKDEAVKFGIQLELPFADYKQLKGGGNV